MEVTLLQLRSFLAVARCGGFTTAADALHRTQPAVTAQVRQLEDVLGLTLFDRSTRRLKLTSTGAEMFAALSQILKELDDVVETSRNILSKQFGTVRIGCLPSVAAQFLPPKIAAFRQKHPNIAFRLNDALGDRVVSLVKSEEVEFGITDINPGTSELDVVPLMEDRIYALFIDGHPIGGAARIDIEELSRHSLILMSTGSSVRRIIDTAFASSGRQARAAFEANYNATAVGMVRSGLGVGLLPAASVDMQVDSRLRSRVVEAEGFSRRVALVKGRGKTLSPAAQAFVETLVP
jgi:LysR family carnitine catabolism transcriptional activator